mmetsp:Transcript_19017/g.48008  ORF Transcript_19017/g.48008 Transcript_19017/m.48008 type:complete len:223 (-) Transcript_19017:180-848(-)
MASSALLGATTASLASCNAKAARQTRKAGMRARVVCSAQRAGDADVLARRAVLGAGLLAAAAPLSIAAPAAAVGDMAFKEQVVCDAECVSTLDNIPVIENPSGLKYQDIKKGKGPSPPTGYQVTVHYTAMTPSGQVFASSYESGKPYDVRVGAGQIVKGLDEGLLSMQVGGIRRIYIPGDLAFPKGLASAPGRPRIPPNSPCVFDVSLLYIPGLDFDEEDYE